MFNPTQVQPFARLSALKACEPKDLPHSLLFIPWGTTQTPQGPFIVDEETLACLDANQRKIKRERVALDFNHNTVEGHTSYRGEPVQVAGWGTPRCVAGQGIFIEGIEYTPEGLEAVSHGHYPDLSLAPVRDGNNRVIAIHSGAFCRHGEVDGATVFGEKAVAALSASVSALSTETKKDTTMDYKKILCVMLGFAETATDDEIMTAAKAFAGKEKTEGADTLLKKLTEIEGKVVTLTADLETERKNHAIALAIRDGKVVPLNAEKLSLADLTQTLGALPANVVPLDQRTPEGVKALAATGTATPDTGAAAAVRKNLGITEDRWNKTNK